VAVSLIGEGNGAPTENHRSSASHWQTLSHNVVSDTPRMNRIRTHNVSGTLITYVVVNTIIWLRPRRPLYVLFSSSHYFKHFTEKVLKTIFAKPACLLYYYVFYIYSMILCHLKECCLTCIDQ